MERGCVHQDFDLSLKFIREPLPTIQLGEPREILEETLTLMFVRDVACYKVSLDSCEEDSGRLRGHQGQFAYLFS